jgi:predicted transcriptional regulator of viral defense system
VVRLNLGKYATGPLEARDEAIPAANRLVIARELVDGAPYYISHNSALEVHNKLTRWSRPLR